MKVRKSMDDKMIIDLFYERSEQAIAETRTKYSTIVRRTAFHILNNLQDTEECENDTYLVAWNKIPPETPDPLAAYLCRISRNLALKRYEANTALKRNSRFDVSIDELKEVFGTTDNNPASDYEVKELTNAIESFLDTLKEDERKLFVRRYWFSYSVKDLAANMQTRPHRVTVKLSRIRGRLQKYLMKEGLMS